MPHEFNAELENIHLVALFYSLDAKEFRINKVSEPIIKDLVSSFFLIKLDNESFSFKLLETKGVQVGNEFVEIRGTIGAFTFDDQGGNQLFRLPESFSKTHYCRICVALHLEAQTLILEKEDNLRSKFLNPRCENGEFLRNVGCKEESVFRNLLCFHDSMIVL